MYKNKTDLDSRQDLTLYIEGLLQREEEDKVEAKVDVSLDVPSDVFNTEVETNNQNIGEEISDIPAWGQKPFECLLIKAAGKVFITPTMTVSFIERINKKIIRIPIETDSFHGVITLRGKSVAVIDLFSVITEDRNNNNSATSEITTHHIELVLVMENGSYALACDEVSKMITLNADDVRWNRTGDNNLFYSGIVKDYLCPLININNLHQRILTMPFVQSLSEGNH